MSLATEGEQAIERLTPDSDGQYFHTIQSGETLSGIAGLYEISLGDLMAWNELGVNSIIRPGQNLLLLVTPPATRTPTPGPPTATAVVAATVTPTPLQPTQTQTQTQPQSQPLLSVDDPIESQVRVVASNFRCACGGCGELQLAKCFCDMPKGAVEEKAFIREQLKKGFSVEQVIDMVDKKYGLKNS